jgi:hypothetical protein
MHVPRRHESSKAMQRVPEILNATFFMGGLRWPGHKVEYPSPSSSKVKNKWSYASTYPICLHNVDHDSFKLTRFLDYQMPDYRILTVKYSTDFWSQVFH